MNYNDRKHHQIPLLRTGRVLVLNMLLVLKETTKCYVHTNVAMRACELPGTVHVQHIKNPACYLFLRDQSCKEDATHLDRNIFFSSTIAL